MAFEWAITVKRNGSTETYAADGLYSPTYPTIEIGGRERFPFRFEPSGVYSAGYGEQYGLNYGGDTSTGHREVYRILRQLLDAADEAAYQSDVGYQPWFREGPHSHVDLDSIVVRLEPMSDIGEMRGVWGIVVGGQDGTRFVDGIGGELELEVYILATASAYASHADIIAALSPSRTQG